MYVSTENMKRIEWDEEDWPTESLPFTVEVYSSQGTLQSTQALGPYNYALTCEGNAGYRYNIPHFHRLKRKGHLLPHTPWRRYKFEAKSYGNYWQRYVYPDGHYQIEYADPWPMAYIGSWLPQISDLEALVPSDYEKYVQNAAARIYTSGWDALTFLAEFREIPRMFMQIGKRLLRADLRKALFNPKLPAKDLFNDWLTARYGFRPLVYDFQDLVKLIKDLREKSQRDRFSERTGHTNTWADITDVTNVLTNRTDTYHIYDSYSAGVRGSITADIHIPYLQANPLLTAWELVPCSFVLDWFVEIGRELAAMHFLAFNTKYSASAGYKVSIKRRVLYECTAVRNTLKEVKSSGEANIETSLEYRVPCQVPTTPHLAFRVDNFKILDLVSLVAQRVRRH
jgi:hypothetical protein